MAAELAAMLTVTQLSLKFLKANLPSYIETHPMPLFYCANRLFFYSGLFGNYIYSYPAFLGTQLVH